MPEVNNILLSIVMPCLNEESTLGDCIKKAFEAINGMHIKGEVVVADNGSTDNSVNIARSMGARVIVEPLKGYGNALIGGIKQSYGKYVIMGDADGSYSFLDSGKFVSKLNEGFDVVMGSRLKGKIEKGAMSLSHRLGNPVMTWFLNLLYHANISDVNCGLRAFTRDAFEKLDLKCGGMEFASEFVVKAAKERLKISEVPITLYKDGRSRPPHLKTFQDGWRHLRFLLIYSPTFLYMLPGAALFLTGFFILIKGLFTTFKIWHFTIDYHVSFLGAAFTIIGFQFCMLGLFARSFAYIKGFDKHDRFIKNYINKFSLERNLVYGLLMTAFGMLFFVTILVKWISSGFGPLFEVRKGIIGVTLLAVGFQYIASSFFLSMLYSEAPKK